MENPIQKIEKEFRVIGRHKYQELKKYDFDNMSVDELLIFKQTFKMSAAQAEKEIQKYESKNSIPNKKAVSDYFNQLDKATNGASKVLTKEVLWAKFINSFNKINNTKREAYNFDKNRPFAIENMKPLIYYFIGDEDNFIKCEHVSSISKPSISKGLLIIGGYGNGKSSVMRSLEDATRNTSVFFKGYTANEVVEMYESCKTPSEKQDFNARVNKGTVFFDDVKTERDASNYGKSVLFKDILEKRYDNNKRTYLTCNFDDNYPNNISKGLEQFGEKYGSRVYDRLFEMFNVIEFKGKSFRE